MTDVLITPASSKVEFKDATDNIDGKIELDGSGNLNITAPGGDLVLGDTTSNVYIGNGVNNIDLIFEQNGFIRGTSGVTLTVGDSVSNITMGTDLNLNTNDLLNVGTINGSLPSNWDSAYNNYITGISVSGTTTKTITLTQRDGGTISANFTDIDTNTTYTAGKGLTLTGTTFDVNVNATAQTTGANSVTTTSSRTYAIQVDGSDNLVVNVPWTDTDTNTTYTAGKGLTLTGTTFDVNVNATAQTTGANSVTTTASRTYAIQVDGSDNLVVNVPWSDTNTTYSIATSTTAGLVEVFSDTDQTVAANAVSATAGRTYGIQLNAANQMVVNVPWTDTDTNYYLTGLAFNGSGTLTATVSGAANPTATLGSGDVTSALGYTPYQEDTALSTTTISASGNLTFTGTATTTSQDLGIIWTGFDKEGVTDFSDTAYIKHLTNTGGHTGSVLVISSQNDANDGIAFSTNASSNLKHNSNVIWTEGNDGAGSGLDADKLDGQEGSYYLNTSTTFGGDVSGTYNAIVVSNDSHTHAFNNLTGKTSGTGEYKTTGAFNGGSIEIADTLVIDASRNLTNLGNITASGQIFNSYTDSGTDSTLRGFELNISGQGTDSNYTSIFGISNYATSSNTSGTHTVGSLYGDYNTVGVVVNSSATSTSVTTMIGTYTGLQLRDLKGNALSVGTVYGHYIDKAPGTNATATNAYGLYIEDHQLGTSINYAIYSQGGNNYFGGPLELSDGTNTITASMLSTDTLSFSGDAGQLFSITDSLSGTIFSVNDISGVPSIEVDDDGTIRLAETVGNVLIGTATDNGTDKVQINGSISSSDGTSANWKQAYDNYITGISVSGTTTKTITLTQRDGGTITGTFTDIDTNTTYSIATSTTAGLVEVFSDTDQTVAANAVSATAGRTYGIQLNAANQMVVNVPWSDTNTTYSQATSSVLGLVKIGFAESGQDYPVELNASGQMFVNVPWTDTDTNTTYTAGKGLTLTGTTFDVNVNATTQTTGANSVTTDASRTYAIQVDGSDNLVVNVPWTDTDTNTTYTAGKGLTLTGTTFDVNVNATAQTTGANSVTTTASRTYAIQVDGSDNLVVNVPWSDTNTTYSIATSTTAGLVEVFSDTDQTVAANAVSATAGRTYGIQLNAANQMVVNVPWTDTDTNNYVSGLSFSGGTLTATRSGLTDLTVDLDGRYLPLSGGTMTGDLEFGVNYLRFGSIADGRMNLSYGSFGAAQRVALISLTNGTSNDVNFAALQLAGKTLYITDALNNRVSIDSNTGNVNLYTGNLQIGSTTVIDSSRNLTNINNGTFGGDLLPDTDNTGVVGNASFTWNNGQFTNLTVDSTLTVTSTLNVRAAIDLADSDVLRMGSSDDWALWYNGTTNKGQIEMESACLGIQITDNATEKFYFEKSTGNFTATGNVTAYSDERLKENVQTLDGSKVLQMRGVSFTKDGQEGSGVIAQELEKVAPELVNSNGEYKSVAYGNLTGYLIEAVKQQQSQIERLEKLVQQLMEK